MTDQLDGLTVILERDIRTDDAEGIIDAIKRLRGVLDVVPLVADSSSCIAEVRARNDLGQKLLAIVYPKRGG